MKNYVTRWNEIIEDVSKSSHAQSLTATQKLQTYWGLLTQAERKKLSDSLHTSRAFRSDIDDERESRRLRRAIVAVIAVMAPMPRNRVEATMRDLPGAGLSGILNNFIARLIDHFPDQVTYAWPAVNCYAYAMRCRNPGGRRGGTAVPGISGGKAPYNLGDHLKVRVGAVADGAYFYGMNSRPPFQPPANRYFIALFSRPGGFHWIRRDNTGLWSWKEGNGGKVQGTVSRTPAPDDIAPRKMHRYIKDPMIPDLSQGDYRPWNSNDTFRGLFTVPSVGLTVDAP
jgi:hypothetical protein